MRLLSFFLVMSCGLFIPVQRAASQDRSTFIGGNIVYGFPTGDFANGYKRVGGVEASLGAGSSGVYLLATTGILSYANQSNNGFGRISSIPLKGGVRLYATKKIFLAGNLGAVFIKDQQMSSRAARFTYDAGIGYHGALGQLGIHYDGWKRKSNPGTSNSVQLKLGLALR
ncbi:MAG TPA: hypothetical protein PKE63_06860 [Lacibacter sp.]|nr:hypothetical protein [Lacibacter sp.]HMO87612.1 hypothetical protein [Lacibacter sp.]HMP86980.1 hypothetical protein [Lacibacter sp.]